MGLLKKVASTISRKTKKVLSKTKRAKNNKRNTISRKNIDKLKKREQKILDRRMKSKIKLVETKNFVEEVYHLGEGQQSVIKYTNRIIK